MVESAANGREAPERGRAPLGIGSDNGAKRYGIGSPRLAAPGRVLERIKTAANRPPEDDEEVPTRDPKVLLSELEAAVQLPPAYEWEAKTGLPLPGCLEEIEELLALTGMPLDVIFSGEWTLGEVGAMLMGALQRRREAEAKMEGDTTGRPMVDDDWAFLPSGNGYKIAAFGKGDNFPKLTGFDHIYKLLQRAGEDVPMPELIGGAQDERIERDGHSQQPALDDG